MPDLYPSGVAGAAGTVTLTVQVRGQFPWQIRRVSPEMLAGSAASVSGTASCAIRKNGYLHAPAVAQGDALEGEPLDLQPGADTMTIEWVGATPGNICRALVTYREIR